MDEGLHRLQTHTAAIWPTTDKIVASQIDHVLGDVTKIRKWLVESKMWVDHEFTNTHPTLEIRSLTHEQKTCITQTMLCKHCKKWAQKNTLNTFAYIPTYCAYLNLFERRKINACFHFEVEFFSSNVIWCWFVWSWLVFEWLVWELRSNTSQENE